MRENKNLNNRKASLDDLLKEQVSDQERKKTLAVRDEEVTSNFNDGTENDEEFGVTSKLHNCISQMMQYGVHIGHHQNETSLSMKKQIQGYRNEKAILNRTYTRRQRSKARDVRENVLRQGGHVLIVATRPDLALLAKGMFSNKEGEGDSRESGLISMVTTRQLGGLLTNFTEFGKLMKVAQNKPERLVSKAKKRRYFLHRKGRENRVHGNGMPSLIIFFHTNEHSVAIKEAHLCGIPTIGIVDSDSKRGDRLTYAIPGNDDGRESQFFFMSLMKKARDQAQQKRLKERSKQPSIRTSDDQENLLNREKQESLIEEK